MAKKRKKRNNSVSPSTPGNAVVRSIKEVNWKIVGKLALYFVLFFGLYQLSIQLCEHNNYTWLYDVVIISYVIATSVLCVTFVILNKGISNDIPTKEQLRDDWDDAKKEKYITDLIAGKKKAKKLLFILIPLIFTLLYEVMYLTFFVK